MIHKCIVPKGTPKKLFFGTTHVYILANTKLLIINKLFMVQQMWVFGFHSQR